MELIAKNLEAHNSRGYWSAEEAAERLDAAARANVKTGILLLTKEWLMTAIDDRRLDRCDLRVLVAVARHINRQTAKAWPDRRKIAQAVGVSVETVSNRLLKLRRYGYLIVAREAVAEANNRRLAVYTFGNLDHATIQREVEAFMDRIDDGKVTAHGDANITAKGDVPPKVTAHGGRKSPPMVDSNSYKGTQTLIDSVCAVSDETASTRESGKPFDSSPCHEVGAGEDGELPLDGEIIGKPSKGSAAARRKGRSTGKRPWKWVHAAERERLGQRCLEYAREHDWPPGHLEARLEAFDRHQRINEPASGDWEASLLQWLGDLRFQPNSASRRGPMSQEEIMRRAFGDQN